MAELIGKKIHKRFRLKRDALAAIESVIAGGFEVRSFGFARWPREGVYVVGLVVAGWDTPPAFRENADVETVTYQSAGAPVDLKAAIEKGI